MEIKTVKTDGFEMDFFWFGSGKEVFVILPGVSVVSVMRSREAIKAQYSLFADRYTVYVFDRKKDIKEGYSVEAMADDTAAAMKLLGLSDVVLFGVSQGGMIAQRIAGMYPELVSKLILASTFARNNDVSRNVISEWVRLAKEGDPVALNRAVFGKIYAPELISQNRETFEMLEKEGTPDEIKRFGILSQACLDFDGFEVLEKITCKRIVTGGGKDRVMSDSVLHELAEKLDCGLEIFGDYGHAVYDEAPGFTGWLFDTSVNL